MKRILIALALLSTFCLGTTAPQVRWLNPTLRFFVPPLAATYTPTAVKSVQMVSISLAAATSNTASLSPNVIAANSILIYAGHTTNEVSGFSQGPGWIRGTFTSGSTITALTAGAAGVTGTYTASVVEFLPQFVKSSACGTLAVGATATITAVVLAKTMLVTTGYTNNYATNSSIGINGAVLGVKFNSTTQIGVNTVADNGALTIGYCYLEFK